MSELKVFSIERKEVKSITLPRQFSEPFRKDLIQRAVESVRSIKRQAYGAKPGAGQRASAKLSRRRRDYKGAYGLAIARSPRKTLSRRGTRMYWVGAVAPNTVGGRRAHPPKVSKVWEKEINKKERKKAIRSALAAVLDRALVIQRGHNPPEDYPLAIESALEGINKTKGVMSVLKRFGFEKELERARIKKIRAGRGKSRGRKYKKRKSLLLVVSSECTLTRAGRNISGVNIIPVKHLNAEMLAPGGVAGRITLFTDKAIEVIEKEGLFL